MLLGAIPAPVDWTPAVPLGRKPELAGLYVAVALVVWFRDVDREVGDARMRVRVRVVVEVDVMVVVAEERDAAAVGASAARERERVRRRARMVEMGERIVDGDVVSVLFWWCLP